MWEAFQDFIFNCIQGVQGGVGDWGLAILIVSVIFRIIIFPLNFKQNKSNHQMQKVQPRIQEIQKLYAGDQQKISEETQKLYREAHFNPLSGCLPILLQMPIFIALFQVLRDITTRVDPGTTLSFYGILPNLSYTPVEAFQVGGLLFCIPYFAMVAIFAASIIVPMLLQGNTQKQTTIMMVIMAVFMAYIGCISPAGVLIFWDVSSIFGVVTQLLMKRYYKRKDEEKEEIEVKPVAVSVVRKEKKKRPTKKR